MAVSYKFNGANLDSLNARFLEYVEEKDVEQALATLKRGANINARNPDEDTALLHAVRTHDMPMTLMLIGRKASLDAQDTDGATALIIAARENNLDLCRALIDAGADISIEDRDGRKAFDHALRSANPELVELFTKPLQEILDRIPTSEMAFALRASRRNLDEIDANSGETVMTWAAAQPNQQSIAMAFLEAGASPSATNRDGLTPMEVAQATGNTPMQKLLEEAQQSKTAVPMDKRLPLKPLFTSTN